ncbi:MAG: YitT family protein [Alistipes sp.]|nr:YitT family protein [Alistipes sp.]
MKLQLNLANLSTSVKESVSDWHWWVSMGQIVLGCFLVAVAFVVFINPYDLVPGGIYGLALVLHNLFPSVQVGTFGYMFDVPLIITALLLFGGTFGGRTIFASFLTPGIMNILDYLVYPNQAAIEALDPTLLLGGTVDLSQHLMLAAIIGGCFSGVGVGIVIRNNAATGGTDITGMLLHKFAKMKFANGVLLSDAIIVLSGLVVIGFGVGLPEGKEAQGLLLSLYSAVCIFVNAKVLGYTIDGASRDKLLYIICDEHSKDMREYILHELNRGGTYIKAKGMYTDRDKEMIFLVVNRKEVRNVQHKIKEFDPKAFVVVTDAYDTFGEGFKPFPEDNAMPTE